MARCSSSLSVPVGTDSDRLWALPPSAFGVITRRRCGHPVRSPLPLGQGRAGDSAPERLGSLACVAAILNPGKRSFCIYLSPSLRPRMILLMRRGPVLAPSLSMHNSVRLSSSHACSGGGLGLGRHVGSLRAPSASRRPPRHEPVYLSLREAQARLSCTVPVVVVEHQRPLWSILVPTLRACEAPACADWVDGGGPTAGGGRRCRTEEPYWRSSLFRFHAVLILTGTAFQNPSRKLVDLLAVLASSLRHGVGRS